MATRTFQVRDCSRSETLSESVPEPPEFPGVFSLLLNRHNHLRSRWPSFSVGTRSLWTKYCLLCTICGSAATILAAIFLVVAALFRYYTTSTYYFETVPTYIPAILVCINCFCFAMKLGVYKYA